VYKCPIQICVQNVTAFFLLNAASAMAILDKDDYEGVEHGAEGNDHDP
jgi:hypothetical protein